MKNLRKSFERIITGGILECKGLEYRERRIAGDGKPVPYGLC